MRIGTEKSAYSEQSLRSPQARLSGAISQPGGVHSGYSTVRSYSIASAPNSDGYVELTVERLPNGEVSPYLTQELAVGDRLELRGPIGEWFVWRTEQTEPIQLIAGGSGIVPLMAMIRSHASAAAPRRFDCCIRYANRERFFTAMNCRCSQIAIIL